MKCPYCENNIREVMEEEHPLANNEKELYTWRDCTPLKTCLEDLRKAHNELLNYVREKI